MFIQIEETPNPATLKFLPGQIVMPKGTADFKKAEDSSNAPLAKMLFAVEGVEAVFLGHDFVTITKKQNQKWDTLKPHLLAAIMDHCLSGLPAINDENANPQANTAAPEGPNSEIISKICELIETRVRPAVAQDGGDIIFDRFEEGIVYLHMRGACSGCPSSTATLKSGIENMLKHYVPEVHEVRQALD